MNSSFSDRLCSRAITVCALAVYGLCLARPIELTSADLGRHLKNGEIFFQQHRPIGTNFYSYTQPDYPAVNHHWGSGAIFFLAWKLGGFAGLHLLFLALNMVTLGVLFRLAAQRAGPGVAALLLALVAPLLAVRWEIRPEVFSYLFVAVFLRQLWLFRDRTGAFRTLKFLPLLEVLWVNTHIYFVLGPALIGAFLLEAVCSPASRRSARALAGVLALTTASTLLNPFGLAGTLAPFMIFRNYGYRVLENQPVWFLERLIPNPHFLVFKLAFGVLVVSMVLAWVRARQRVVTAETLLAAGVSAMGWLALRNFTLFGAVALPVMAGHIRAAFGSHLERLRRPLHISGLAVLLLLVSLVAMEIRSPLSPSQGRTLGIGLKPGNNRAAEFLRQTGIQGPILNNYDIGGYLIFHLFPEERVFVDNRPEAYSNRFFQEIYVPLQEDELKWREAERQYRFNAIVFNRLDATPWGQPFLIRRIEDPTWAPVFVDDDVIILLKRTLRNQPLIRQYEIPSSVFRVVPRAG